MAELGPEVEQADGDGTGEAEPSRCPKCRYLLEGLPTVDRYGCVRCPECGWRGVPPVHRPWEPSEEHGCVYALLWWIAVTVGFGLLVVVVGLVAIAARML